MTILFTEPSFVPVSGNSVVYPGAKLFFYETGTSNLQNTYSEYTLTTAHANPVVADADGRFTPIYLDPSLKDYKVVLKDSSDVTIWTVDPYSAVNNTTALATMSALLSASTALGTVSINGYHSSGDGGGGDFYWDASQDKANHNGGTIIDPDITFPSDWTNQTQLSAWFTAGTGTGCWVRSYQAVYAKYFGAKEDGSTDDTKANQQAINFAESLGGFGAVLLTPGKTTKITAALEINEPISMGGDNGLAQIYNSSTTDNAIEFTTPSATTPATTPKNGGGLFNVSIYRDADSSTGSAVKLTRWNSARFESCNFQSHHDNVHISGCSNITFTDCRWNMISSVYTNKSGGAQIRQDALLMSDASYTKSFSTHLNNPRMSDSGRVCDTAIELNNADNFKVNGGYIGYHKAAITLKPTNNQSIVSVRFDDTYIDGVDLGATTAIVVNQNSTTGNEIGYFQYTGGMIGQVDNVLEFTVNSTTATRFRFTGVDLININENVLAFNGSSVQAEVIGCRFRRWGINTASRKAISVLRAQSLMAIGNIFQSVSETTPAAISIESTAAMLNLTGIGNTLINVTTPYTQTGTATNKTLLGNVSDGTLIFDTLDSAPVTIGTTLGSVTHKFPVYDSSGSLLGYAPVYDAIT